MEKGKEVSSCSMVLSSYLYLFSIEIQMKTPFISMELL